MKKRLLFLTVWLWIIIIVGAFIAIGSFTDALHVKKLASSDNPFTKMLLQKRNLNVEFYANIACSIIGLVNIVASVLILKWDKNGFWAMISTCVTSFLLLWHASYGGKINVSALITFFACLIGFIILVIVVQIKIDDKNCWEQLE